MFQILKRPYLVVLKSSSNLRKHKNLIRRCTQKGKTNGKRHSWIRNLLFGFREVNKPLVIFRYSLQHSIKFFFQRWQWNFIFRTRRTFYDYSPFFHDFFPCSFSIGLRSPRFCLWFFLLLGLKFFFVATSISFKMILIAWSSVSKLGVPSLGPCWKMWNTISISVIACIIESMVVFSSIDAFDQDILPCIVSFGGKTPT